MLHVVRVHPSVTQIRENLTASIKYFSDIKKKKKSCFKENQSGHKVIELGYITCIILA